MVKGLSKLVRLVTLGPILALLLHPLAPATRN